jgi:hypothetical protein
MFFHPTHFWDSFFMRVLHLLVSWCTLLFVGHIFHPTYFLGLVHLKRLLIALLFCVVFFIQPKMNHIKA